MSEIALYDTLRKIPEVSDAEAKEAVADVASNKDVATKADIIKLKAETKTDIKDMATKSDIAEVKADIAEVKGELKADITELKADITELKADGRAMKWMLGLLLAINVAFIVSAVSLLVRFA